MIDIMPLIATVALLALPQVSSTDPPSTTSLCANPDDFHCTIGITNVNIRKGDPYTEEYKKGCIPASWVCDQKLDCADYSDELDCGTQCVSATDFQCTRGATYDAGRGDTYDVEEFKGCIPSESACDDTYGCADRSDEMNCPTPPAPNPSDCTNSSYFKCEIGATAYVLESYAEENDRRGCIPKSWHVTIGLIAKRRKLRKLSNYTFTESGTL